MLLDAFLGIVVTINWFQLTPKIQIWLWIVCRNTFYFPQYVESISFYNHIIRNSTTISMFGWEVNMYRYFTPLTCYIVHMPPLIPRKQMKFILKTGRKQLILYRQRHVCRCPGDSSSRAISSYCIQLVYLEYYNPNTTRRMKQLPMLIFNLKEQTPWSKSGVMLL